MTQVDYRKVALVLLSSDVVSDDSMRTRIRKNAETSLLLEFLQGRPYSKRDESSADWLESEIRKWGAPSPTLIQWDICLPMDGKEAYLLAIQNVLKEAGINFEPNRHARSRPGIYTAAQMVFDEDILEAGYKVAPFQLFFHPDDLPKIKALCKKESALPGTKIDDADGIPPQNPGHQKE